MKDQIQLERVVALRLFKADNKRGYVEIAVVDWVGEKTYRLLEKRELYTQDDGSYKMGKAKGFNRADFALLLGKAREIADCLMQTPTPAPKPAPSESSGESEASPAGRADPF